MIRLIALLILLAVMVVVRIYVAAVLSTTRTPWATLGRAFAMAALFVLWGLIPPQCTRNQYDEPPDYRPLRAKLPGAFRAFAVVSAGILWAAWSERKRFPNPDEGFKRESSEEGEKQEPDDDV